MASDNLFKQEIIPDNMRPCPICGHLLSLDAETCPHCGHVLRRHHRITAALLAIFLGGFGIHKFYLGRPIQGIIYLLFCFTGLPAIIGFIEGIIYLLSDEQSFNQKYR